MRNWLTGRGPVQQAEPLDAVQLAVNHASAVAALMGFMRSWPGWSTVAPADLYDMARWLMTCRRNYGAGGKWGGHADR